MTQKEFFVMLASNKPSAKTFICEVESMILSLSKHDGCDVKTIKLDQMKRVVFSLDKEIVDPSLPEVNLLLDDKIVIECRNFQNVAHSQAILTLKKILKFTEEVLLHHKDESSMKDIQIENGVLRVTFGKPISSSLPSTEKRSTLLLIDGSNLLSRAYFATSFKGDLMTNQEGLYTNGVFIFVKKLLRLIERFQATHVVVCWDVGRSETFRRQIYPDYKGLREETEIELKQQYETTEKLLSMMNVPQMIKTFSNFLMKRK